jgi:hypothetical protein
MGLVETKVGNIVLVRKKKVEYIFESFKKKPVDFEVLLV